MFVILGMCYLLRLQHQFALYCLICDLHYWVGVLAVV